MFWSIFVFWSISSDTLVPWSPWSPGTQAAFLNFLWSKWAWEKKSKKKPSALINFCFLVNLIIHTGPMVTMVTRYTGSLSALPVVEMSWGKKILEKTKCSDQLLFSGQFHQTHWSHGHHGHHRAPGTQASYLSFQWSKWAGEKNLRKNLLFWPTFVFWSILSDTPQFRVPYDTNSPMCVDTKILWGWSLELTLNQKLE